MQGGAGRGAAGRKKPSKRVIGEIPQDDVSSFLLKGLKKNMPRSFKETAEQVSMLRERLVAFWEEHGDAFSAYWRDLCADGQKTKLREACPYMPDRAAEPTVDGECHAELAVACVLCGDFTVSSLLERGGDFLLQRLQYWGASADDTGFGWFTQACWTLTSEMFERGLLPSETFAKSNQVILFDDSLRELDIVIPTAKTREFEAKGVFQPANLCRAVLMRNQLILSTLSVLADNYMEEVRGSGSHTVTAPLWAGGRARGKTTEELEQLWAQGVREVGAVTRALVLQEAADERKKARNRKLRDKKKKKKMAKKEAADVEGALGGADVPPPPASTSEGAAIPPPDAPEATQASSGERVAEPVAAVGNGEGLEGPQGDREEDEEEGPAEAAADECAICLVPLDFHISVLQPCKHEFHYICAVDLTVWCEQKGIPMHCPMCRATDVTITDKAPVSEGKED